MKEDLKKLYTRVIKAHHETPYHFNRNENAQAVIESFNPICGDRYEIYIDIDTGKINSVYFHGFGCAISKASASVLLTKLDGKELQEASSICDNFLKFLNKELNRDELILEDELLAFAGVHDFPERYECAAGSWKAVKFFLDTQLKT